MLVAKLDVVAEPFSVAVIVPAEKLPAESRLTILLTTFSDTASDTSTLSVFRLLKLVSTSVLDNGDPFVDRR
jgi:hypothetical protein